MVVSPFTWPCFSSYRSNSVLCSCLCVPLLLGFAFSLPTSPCSFSSSSTWNSCFFSGCCSKGGVTVKETVVRSCLCATPLGVPCVILKCDLKWTWDHQVVWICLAKFIFFVKCFTWESSLKDVKGNISVVHSDLNNSESLLWLFKCEFPPLILTSELY